MLNAKKKLVVYIIVHYGRKKSHQDASGPKSGVKEGREFASL